MTSHMSVTITASSRDLLPPKKRIRKLFAKHTDHSFEAFTSDDDGDLRLWDERVDNHARRSFTWQNKWQTDGIAQFGRILSIKYPGCTVTVDHEWDAHDADEPGSEGWRWLEGKLVATMSAEPTWSDTTSSSAGQPVLHTPEGVKHSPILLVEKNEEGHVIRLEVGIKSAFPSGLAYETRLLPSSETDEEGTNGNVFVYSEGEATAHVAWSMSDPLEEAVAEFVRVFQSWDGEAFRGLQCVEAESLAAIATTYGDAALGTKIIQLHAAGDDDEDDQHHDIYQQWQRNEL